MKKIITIILTISTLMLLSACEENTSPHQQDTQQNPTSSSTPVSENIPDIVFLYSSHYNNESFTTYVFDKNGNIYHSSKEEAYYLNYKELLELYAAGKLEDRLSLAGTVPPSEIEENVQTFLQIMHDGGVELTSEESLSDIIVLQEKWYGLYYDIDGNVNITLLYKKDDGKHEANDSRVDEIVDWMNKTIKNNTLEP